MKANTRLAFPVLLLIELALCLGASLLLLAASAAADAPLHEAANPNLTPNPAKAPWFFVGLQELLQHGHPALTCVTLPGLALLFLFALPYLDHRQQGSGRWFTSARGVRISLYAAVYALVAIPALVALENQYPPRLLLRFTVTPFVREMLIPGAALALFVLLPLLVLLRFRPDGREILLLLFTLLIVSAFVFTFIGFFLRGPGFELRLPWDMPGRYNPWGDF